MALLRDVPTASQVLAMRLSTLDRLRLVTSIANDWRTLTPDLARLRSADIALARFVDDIPLEDLQFVLGNLRPMSRQRVWTLAPPPPVDLVGGCWA